jgi:FkbM family methyltransferase
MFSRLTYYLSSIPTLLGGIRNWWALIRLALHRRDSAPVVIDLHDGSRFKVRSLMDVWIIKETCLDRDYEDDSIRIGEDSVVMDIGAGLGDFCVEIARGHPRRRIFAYEPFAESFQLLKDNLTLNGISNVQAFPCAIGACSGKMTLQISTQAAVQHSTASAEKENRAASNVEVEGLSLDDVFRSLGISRCDLLKVDCEGGEYDIFFHASPDALRRIETITMEYHDGANGYTHGELINFFQSLGLSVKTRPNPVHKNIGLLTASRPPRLRAQT